MTCWNARRPATRFVSGMSEALVTAEKTVHIATSHVVLRVIWRCQRTPALSYCSLTAAAAAGSALARHVAQLLRDGAFATLLMDLLTAHEEKIDNTLASTGSTSAVSPSDWWERRSG